MSINWTIKKKFFLNSTEEGKKEILKQDGEFIKYIKNPSKEMQLISVKENGFNIEYIKNPEEDVQLEAVRNEGCSLEYIKNPSYKVQLEAVKSSPAYAYSKIKNITREMQEIIVDFFYKKSQLIDIMSQNYDLQDRINEFDEDMILKMIQIDGCVIGYIKQQTNEMCIEALKQKGEAIQGIKKQTEELQLLALANLKTKTNKIWIFDLSIATEKVNIELAKKFDVALRYIKNPSFDVIKTAIDSFSSVMMMLPLKYQTKEVQLYALQKDIDNIRFIKNTDKEVMKYFLDNYDIGTYNNIRPNKNVCKGCKEECLYKFNNGIYDGCPRFLEHLASKK